MAKFHRLSILIAFVAFASATAAVASPTGPQSACDCGEIKTSLDSMLSEVKSHSEKISGGGNSPAEICRYADQAQSISENARAKAGSALDRCQAVLTKNQCKDAIEYIGQHIVPTINEITQNASALSQQAKGLQQMAGAGRAGHDGKSNICEAGPEELEKEKSGSSMKEVAGSQGSGNAPGQVGAESGTPSSSTGRSARDEMNYRTALQRLDEREREAKTPEAKAIIQQVRRDLEASASGAPVDNSPGANEKRLRAMKYIDAHPEKNDPVRRFVHDQLESSYHQAVNGSTGTGGGHHPGRHPGHHPGHHGGYHSGDHGDSSAGGGGGGGPGTPPVAGAPKPVGDGKGSPVGPAPVGGAKPVPRTALDPSQIAGGPVNDAPSGDGPDKNHKGTGIIAAVKGKVRAFTDTLGLTTPELPATERNLAATPESLPPAPTAQPFENAATEPAETQRRASAGSAPTALAVAPAPGGNGSMAVPSQLNSSGSGSGLSMVKYNGSTYFVSTTPSVSSGYVSGGGSVSFSGGGSQSVANVGSGGGHPCNDLQSLACKRWRCQRGSADCEMTAATSKIQAIYQGEEAGGGGGPKLVAVKDRDKLNAILQAIQKNPEALKKVPEPKAQAQAAKKPSAAQEPAPEPKKPAPSAAPVKPVAAAEEPKPKTPKWVSYLPEFLRDSSLVKAFTRTRGGVRSIAGERAQIGNMHGDLFSNVNRAYAVVGSTLQR